MNRALLPLVVGAALGVSGCVVKTSGSGTAQSPSEPPPDEERVASTRADTSQPEEAPPPDEERVPSRRAEPAQPQPPAQPGNERVPSRRAEPPAQPQPPRSNERVPSRRARPNIPFSIEPTAGPVGTTVTIYGDFSVAMPQKNQLWVKFGKVQAKPSTVAADAVNVIVPRGATSGAVQVGFRRRVLWTGEFAVTAVDEGILVPTEGGKGLLGAVYTLPPKTRKLPDFATLGQPFATITVPKLEVKARNFKAGFPGLGGKNKLLEWFAIRFEGQLMVPKSGSYRFRTVSDDGSKVYIDGNLVLDNDGVHPPRMKDSGAVQLGAGAHSIVVEYFQGPRFQIALELWWNQPGGRWDVIKPKFFRR